MQISNILKLVPGNLTSSEVGFLADENVLAEYSERVRRYPAEAQVVLYIFSIDKEGIIKGSNPFANVEIASLDLALPSELEHAVRISPDTFRDTYTDTALLLRSEGDNYGPNTYVARHLAEQVKHRTGNIPTPELPARISLKGLKLQKGENPHSSYRLVFLLGDSTDILFSPEFSHANYGRSFSRTDERGVPIWDENGNRRFYTREVGLSGLCLSRRSLNLNSYNANLASSNADGRVAVVKSAAGTQEI